LRIVHLIWGFRIGGAEAMLADIAGAQAEHHEVCIVVVNRDFDASLVAQVGTRVRLLVIDRPPGSGNPWHLLRLLRTLRRLRPDIIHAHEASFSWLCRLVPVPVVLTVHNTRLSLGRGIDTFAEVFCISAAVQRDVHERSGRSGALVYNGVPFAAIPAKSTYGGSPFRVVQVGRLAHGQKGQDLLIQALRIVRERMPTVVVRVDFIGAGESLGHLESLARQCNVSDECAFLGALPRAMVYEKLRDYDLLVQPSRYEGFGLTVIEGIAAGLPVLVADIEGPREILARGLRGWTFRSEDPDDLAARLAELIDASHEGSFGESMRAQIERARALFDVSLTAQGYCEAYRRVTRVAGNSNKAGDAGIAAGGAA